MHKEFEIDDHVRFIEHVLDEFTVTGHLLDDDDRPMKDYVFLKSNTNHVRIRDAIHSADLELVPTKPAMPAITGVFN